MTKDEFSNVVGEHSASLIAVKTETMVTAKKNVEGQIMLYALQVKVYVLVVSPAML